MTHSICTATNKAPSNTTTTRRSIHCEVTGYMTCSLPLDLKLFLDNKTGCMFWEQQQIGYTERAVKGTNTKNKSNIREIKYQYTFLRRENS